MATSKTLNPTNTTVSIPAMTDRPNQSVNSNTMSALADAVNANYEAIVALAQSKLVNDTAGKTSRTYSVGSSMRYLIFGVTGFADSCFAAIVIVSSQGTVSVHTISKGNNVSFDVNTSNKFKVTYGTSTSCLIYVFAQSQSWLNGFSLDS